MLFLFFLQKSVSPQILDFTSKSFLQKKYWFGAKDYFNFLQLCMMIDYTPPHFKSRIVPIIENTYIDFQYFDQDPIQVAFVFHKLGIKHKFLAKYADEVRRMELEEQSNKRSKSIESKEKVLKSTDVEFGAELETFIGANKLLYDIRVDDDLTVPFMFKVNTKTGEFLDMQSKSLKKNLTCAENELL